jgi:ATP-dependent protease HslVU (ClpYQ) peptidase subunit
LKSFTFSVRGELVEPQKNTFAIGSLGNNYGLTSKYQDRRQVVEKAPKC